MSDRLASGMWAPMSDVNSGPARTQHHVVWTGTEMIVIGGIDPADARFVDGGRAYNPETDTWRSLSPTDLMGQRFYFTMVWTGQEVLIWGGSTQQILEINLPALLNTGVRYDPAADTWRPMAESPLVARAEPQAVWTGTELLVWGGTRARVDARGVATPDRGPADGARYDPILDRWQMLPTDGAPGSKHFNAVWTGRDMLLWPGLGTKEDVFRFDPTANRWSSLPQPDILVKEEWTGRNLAVWTGTELLILRQSDDQYDTNNPIVGYRIDVDHGTAEPMATDGAPRQRGGAASVWTGAEWVIWGGSRHRPRNFYWTANDGGRYDPRKDAWTHILPEDWFSSDVPVSFQTAVWTGREVLFWGGGCCLRGTGADLAGDESGEDHGIFEPAAAPGLRYQL